MTVKYQRVIGIVEIHLAPPKTEQEERHQAIVRRRNQLLDLISQEENRLRQSHVGVAPMISQSGKNDGKRRVRGGRSINDPERYGSARRFTHRGHLNAARKENQID